MPVTLQVLKVRGQLGEVDSLLLPYESLRSNSGWIWQCLLIHPCVILNIWNGRVLCTSLKSLQFLHASLRVFLLMKTSLILRVDVFSIVVSSLYWNWKPSGKCFIEFVFLFSKYLSHICISLNVHNWALTGQGDHNEVFSSVHWICTMRPLLGNGIHPAIHNTVTRLVILSVSRHQSDIYWWTWFEETKQDWLRNTNNKRGILESKAQIKHLLWKGDI